METVIQNVDINIHPEMDINIENIDQIVSIVDDAIDTFVNQTTETVSSNSTGTTDSSKNEKKSKKKAKYDKKNKKNESSNKGENILLNNFAKSVKKSLCDDFINAKSSQNIFTYQINTINNIQEIKVNVFITYDKKLHKFFLNINNTSIKKCGGGKITMFNHLLLTDTHTLSNIDIKTYENMLSHAMNILKKIKFSKLSGEFIVDDNYGRIEAEYRYLNSINLQNDIIFSVEDCSVCHEKTITKTGCKHSLCFLCWSKLNNRVCPICRHDIDHYCTGHNNIDSDHEADNDEDGDY